MAVLVKEKTNQIAEKGVNPYEGNRKNRRSIT